MGVHIKTEKQKLPHKNTVRQLLLFICCVPCVCRQFRSALFLLCERAFLPAAFVARLSREWKDAACAMLQEMILQNRNHPSIILWGVRINESVDDDAFYNRTNKIAHQ